MFKSICIALKLCSSVSGQAMVIDGDTIIVENVRVRLAGLDAEELSDPNGRHAKRRLLLLIGPDRVSCKLTGEKSYNRYIGTCSIGTLDLATEMVRNGYALDCARYSGGKYRFYEPEGVRSKLKQAPYC
jgi:endonuclease YncB( thermonuclease family)